MRSQRYRFQMLRAMAPKFGRNRRLRPGAPNELFTARGESRYRTNNLTPNAPTVPETGMPAPVNTSSHSAPTHGA